MSNNAVFAIMVTYNPQPDCAENIRRILSQVGRLIIVDNGSAPNNLIPIRQTLPHGGIEIIENGRNLGIAAALNVGVLAARANGARWVCLLDQDSTPADGFIDALLAEYRRRSADATVAIVTPKHLNKDTSLWRKPVFAKDGDPLVAITSGSLMPVEVFDRCGMFEEDLIIDRVDEEYCLRAREMGCALALAPAAILWVRVGSPERYSLFGRTIFTASHYSVGRRYYISRNRLVIVKRYWSRYPLWCYHAVSGLLKDLVKIVLVEDFKGKKIAYTAKGVADAIVGRMGMVVRL